MGDVNSYFHYIYRFREDVGGHNHLHRKDRILLKSSGTGI